MSATLKSLRAAPQRRFENYVFTKFTDPSAGLTNIPDSSFTRVTGSFGPGVGTNFNDDSWSNPIPIGFPFNFDNIVYDHFVVDTNGWMVLVDPAIGTFDITDIMQVSVPAGANVDFDNASIVTANLTNNVLLAPWFDDIFNVVGDSGDLLTSPFNFDVDKVRNITEGIEPAEAWLNAIGPGVGYYNDNYSERGRRLIVRWSSLTSKTYLTSVVNFEAVVYENGTIEFRYAPRSIDVPSTCAPNFHGASIGIFAPGTNRFRDFAVGLDYRQESRQEYVYGGYVYDSNFTDTDRDGTTANYAVNVSAMTNWPARGNAGCLMTFSSPTNKRKTLPRKQLQANDSHTTYPVMNRTGINQVHHTSEGFDDRKALVFGNSSIVNYPTTLTRFATGNTRDTLERQNLFSGDFLVSGSLVKSVVNDYVNDQFNGRVSPFNETSLFEQEIITGDFFASGSETQQFEGKFDQNLKSKTQVRISFSVNNPVKMPGATGSIFYYNARAKGWNVPTNSSYVITGTTKVPAGRGDLASPRQFRNIVGGPQYFEDARGFGALGNIISSGSHVPQLGDSSEQTDFAIGLNYSPDKLATVFGHVPEKSISVNPEYNPVNDETFTIPISAPFLIEKAVIEIPFAAGPDWFADNTQNFKSYIADVTPLGFDIAGPALTVALHRQVEVQNDVSASRRDLILTGTIIPSTDNISAVKIQQDPTWAYTFVRPYGFLAYASNPGAVIKPDASNFFTGSAQVQCVALSTTGFVAQYEKDFSVGTNEQIALDVYKFLTEQPTLSLLSSNDQTVTISSFAPFGRGTTGFNSSGRSILGKEHSTFQGARDNINNTVPNPFYVGQDGISAENQVYFDNAATFGSTQCFAAIQLNNHVQCPYLVMPGDKLVLSISKTRPFIYTRSDTGFSGSIAPHDVTLMPGNINITLYGSLVKENAEFHEPSYQPLGSNVVHEVIGNEPVVDQFDVAYDQEFSGSMITDRFNLESVIPYLYYGKNKSFYIDTLLSVTSSYGTKRYYGHMAKVRGDEDRQSISEDLQWTRRRKIFEFKKRSRTFTHISNNETFWDSRIPDASSIIDFMSPTMLLLNGFGPQTPAGAFLDGDSTAVMFTGRTSTFCLPAITDQTTYGKQGLDDWIMSYPFESKYKDITSTFADKLSEEKLFKTQLITADPPVWITPPGGINFPFGGITFEFGEALGSQSGAGPKYHGMPPTRGWAGEEGVEVGNSGINARGGLGLPEFIKFFYGFGDGRSTVDNGHVKFLGVNWNSGLQTGAEVRGWRHGMISAFPLNTSAIFRRDHFGQHRDMLEQRLDTKFFSTERVPVGEVLLGPVQVRFVDNHGNTTDPYKTLSSNMSTEVTSSLPYFDGNVRNRPDDYSNSNTSIVVI